MSKLTNDELVSQVLRNVKSFNESEEVKNQEILKGLEKSVIECLLQESLNGKSSIVFQMPCKVNDEFLKDYPSIAIEWIEEVTFDSPVSKDHKISAGHKYKFSIFIPQ